MSQGRLDREIPLGHIRQREILELSANDRHASFMSCLRKYYGGNLPVPPDPKRTRTDFEALRDNFRFIRSPEEDSKAGNSWEVKLAQKYYEKLYREYAIADMSRYREGKLGLRWRTQKEVVSGRGQLTCGARSCNERLGLASFEVPFDYYEAGENKSALVKLRLCPEHAEQLIHCRKHEKHHGTKIEKRKLKEATDQLKQKRSKLERKVSQKQHDETVDKLKEKKNSKNDVDVNKSSAERSNTVPIGQHKEKLDHDHDDTDFHRFFKGLFE